MTKKIRFAVFTTLLLIVLSSFVTAASSSKQTRSESAETKGVFRGYHYFIQSPAMLINGCMYWFETVIHFYHNEFTNVISGFYMEEPKAMERCGVVTREAGVNPTLGYGTGGYLDELSFDLLNDSYVDQFLQDPNVTADLIYRVNFGIDMAIETESYDD